MRLVLLSMCVATLIPGSQAGSTWEKLAGMLDKDHGRFHGIPDVFRTQVRMSDGVDVSTSVINPTPYKAKKAAVLCRSPYGHASNWLATLFVNSNFVAVMQDDRGTLTSGGTFDLFRMANDDGVKTMEWIISQPWSNGVVYSVGISADGMGEIAMVLKQPKMLKGQWWGWTTGNGHAFVYPHGMYRQDLLEGYMHAMDLFTRGASVSNIIPAVRHHESWSPWWYNITDCRAPTPCHFANVNFPVVSTAGWWDIFSQVQLDDFVGIRTQSHPDVRDKHVLIIDPLGHCAADPLADVSNPFLFKETAKALQVSADLASEFFKGEFNGSVRSTLKRLNFFVMRDFANPFDQGWWTSLDKWPAHRAWVLHLHHKGALDPVANKESSSVSYSYDPSNPTPMTGGGNIPIVCRTGGNCGSADQLEREGRSDVLTFDSDELKSDLAVVGRVHARLFVSSSANDTDFVVTISDLSPGIWGTSFWSKSMLVRNGALRMRWREGTSNQSSPMQPSQIYEANIDLTTVAYVFPKGHRIRIAVSSAATPYYSPNYNTGKFDFGDAKKHSVIARNTIHTSPQHPSAITLPVVSVHDIPKNDRFDGSFMPKHGPTWV
jgi:predicted acyl esterase